MTPTFNNCAPMAMNSPSGDMEIRILGGCTPLRRGQPATVIKNRECQNAPMTPPPLAQAEATKAWLGLLQRVERVTSSI